MDGMPESLQTIIVFVPFSIMGLALLTFVAFWLYDRIRPLFDNRYVNSASHDGSADGSAQSSRDRHRGTVATAVTTVVERFGTWVRGLIRKHEHDVETGDLNDDATALLAMLPEATVVVNRGNEVIRANPDAYMLGIVDDESIIDATVRDMVLEVRRTGGCRRFDLTTHTPERIASIDTIARMPEETQSDLQSGSVQVRGVARPNWLKVTVGKVGDFVVVLIDDVSESIRFAQVRDSFISNVSEQLLKPSQALEQLAETLADDVMEPEQVSWYAQQVRSSCERLNHMVADLMLLIEAQEPISPSSANRLNMMEQVSLACERLRSDSERYGVAIAISGDETLTVNGNGSQITAAVSKLVQNALVYSPAGGTVNVAVSRSDDGAHAVVEVVDQGVGIAKNEQARIFERFYRGSNQTMRSRGGIGLGLAIVKHVALTHHGNVTVWSAPGSGSTFTFSLPIAQ